jgi:hypothetical protein
MFYTLCDTGGDGGGCIDFGGGSLPFYDPAFYYNGPVDSNSDDEGGGDGGATQPTTKNCAGTARVLQGNAATIGKPGGFSGTTVGNIPITATGAAIITSQWASSKADLRPYLSQISGVFSNVNASFNGIVDVIGAKTGQVPAGFPPDSNVQQDLMTLNPGMLILELPGATKDYGVTAVTLTIPSRPWLKSRKNSWP